MDSTNSINSKRTADELKHARAVREMFGGIAKRYDLLNHVLSINIDKIWRRLVRKKLADILERPDAVVLDVACGTGDLATEMQQHAKAKIIGTDFCRPMLAIAAEKNTKNNLAIPYMEGDAMSLPFADDQFDAVTIAFGLRNLSHFEDGLRELRRILKPGGKLVVLEFSAPVVPGFKQAFEFYFSNILPRIGGAVSGSRGAYQYLHDSVTKFPDQKNLKLMFERVGFAQVEYKNLTGGIAAIHVGTRA